MYRLAEIVAALVFTLLGVLCSIHARNPEVGPIMIGFAVASFMFAGIAIFLLFPGRTRICPTCGSRDTRKVQNRAFFQVLPSYKCSACEEVWEPSSPTWLLFVGVVGSVAAILLGILKRTNGDWVGLLYVSHGTIAFIECLRRLANNTRNNAEHED